MCTKPKMFNGYEVSCRECDHCLATYKNSWVSRCVAEKQTMPHAYAITLTYADKPEIVDGEQVMRPPLGARVYRYKDVQDMWKRIRSAAERKWKNQDFELRYVVVGEKGTRYGRCHYHGVVFASHPIHELGKISGAKSNEFAFKRRLDWSIWGHGFVEFQEADRKGMAYVLKYILKARMTSERSKGFNREGKTEWLASSYLWCSKKPAIGATWLWEKLYDLVAKGMCPPALRVRVPGGGDWYVHDKAQMEMCLYLHEANNRYRQQRGRDLAGWSTLVASVQDEIENTETGEIMPRKPWEWLVNGEEQEAEPIETNPEWERQQQKQVTQEYKAKSELFAKHAEAQRLVRKCGDIIPCKFCYGALSRADRNDIRQEYLLRYEQWRDAISEYQHDSYEHESHRKAAFERWWRTRLRPSRACIDRDTTELQEQFGWLVPVTKAQVGLSHKAAIGKALNGQGRKVPS